MNEAEQLYLESKYTPSDIHEHMDRMRVLGQECQHITEFGTRKGASTAAWVVARPHKLVCYDLVRHDAVDRVERVAKASGIEFVFHTADVRLVTIEPTDLLFIDTLHVYDQLKVELRLHAGNARKYIVMHDTTTFGQRGGGEAGEIPNTLGLWPAIEEFLASHPEWSIRERLTNNNGLTILARI